MKQKLILSPCGTSLLTNKKESFEEDIFCFANMTEKELPPEKIEAFSKTFKSIEKELLEADRKTRRKMSAELNAIYALENEGLQTDTVHLLIETDTFFGKNTAEIIEKLFAFFILNF